MRISESRKIESLIEFVQPEFSVGHYQGAETEVPLDSGMSGHLGMPAV